MIPVDRFLKGHFVRLCSFDRQRQNNYFAYLKLDRFRGRQAKQLSGADFISTDVRVLLHHHGFYLTTVTNGCAQKPILT